jgi:glycosyltransferase involved in cell wall biosynthesis
MRPDIVHFHDAEMLAVLPIARLLWPRARFVYDVHEDFANLMLVRDWLPGPVKPLVRTLTSGCERALARLAHGIVSVTPPLTNRFPHRAKAVAYNFAPDAFFEEAAHQSRRPRDREFDVVHLGTLNLRRAEFLAAALSALRAVRPGARSLIVGAEEDVIRSVAANLPTGCEIVGKVPHDQVPSLLANARVGIDVHPWLSPHLLPAFAVKVCEYMACGCAIVASTMPVLDELLAGSGLEPAAVIRIRGGTPEDYARAVARLLDAIDAGEDPGAAARAFARRSMSFGGEAIKIGRLYRTLLNGTRGAK